MNADVRRENEAMGRFKEAAGSLGEAPRRDRAGRVRRASGRARGGIDRLSARVKETLRRQHRPGVA